jgi:ribose 5-phosphate isomerase A
MNPKQRAAEAALTYVRSNTVLGLGTGSTADYFLLALGEAVRSGRLTGIRGVPTSEATDRRAKHLGIPVVTLAEVGQIDLTIDGADEVTPTRDLIKGLGGALLREKIVAQNSRELMIVADASKRVDRLGVKAAVPVEVIPFGHEIQAKFLANLGCTPALRMKHEGGATGTTFITDSGNYIYDCRFPAAGIPDPKKLVEQLAYRAGVVESGLFLNIATRAIIAADDGAITTL